MIFCRFPGAGPRYPGPHFASTPPRGPPTPQNYPTLAQMQPQPLIGQQGQPHILMGQNGQAAQNVLIGPYNGAQDMQFYPQPGQPQSNCGTPSIASLQMV